MPSSSDKKMSSVGCAWGREGERGRRAWKTSTLLSTRASNISLGLWPSDFGRPGDGGGDGAPCYPHLSKDPSGPSPAECWLDYHGVSHSGERESWWRWAGWKEMLVCERRERICTHLSGLFLRREAFLSQKETISSKQDTVIFDVGNIHRRNQSPNQLLRLTNTEKGDMSL